MNKLLKKLGLEEFNYGASSSYNNCIKNEEQKLISSYNPSDGTLLSSVYKSSIADLDKIIKRSSDAFNEFKKIPAPVRGDLVREMSIALGRKPISYKYYPDISRHWLHGKDESFLELNTSMSKKY